MRQIAIVGSDLIAATRILEAAVQGGFTAVRVDRPDDLPSPEDVVVAVVDWSSRDESWGATLRAWRGDGPGVPRVLLYGFHTDLGAHADARQHQLGPMVARSRLFSSLPELLGP